MIDSFKRLRSLFIYNWFCERSVAILNAPCLDTRISSAGEDIVGRTCGRKEPRWLSCVGIACVALAATEGQAFLRLDGIYLRGQNTFSRMIFRRCLGQYLDRISIF